MSGINRLGTQIVLPDGREGTVVYNGLDGVGIKWGLHDPDPSDFEGTTGGLISETLADDWPWAPDAMLRAPYQYGDPELEYVGGEYEITRVGRASPAICYRIEEQ